MTDFTALDDLELSLRFRWVYGTMTKVKKGFSTRFRTLPYAVIAQSTDGAVTFRVEGERERLIEGDFAIFIPPNRPHEFISMKAYTSNWGHIACTVFGTRDIFSFFNIPYVFRGANSRALGEMLIALAKGAGPAGAKPFFNACSRQQVGLTLVRILLTAGTETTSSDFLTNLARIRPVLRSLESNLAFAITRETLAALVNLSPTRFHTVFKSIIGEAPMHYVRRLRLERARELLLASTAPVGEIAPLVGYPDQFHFSREFKKAFKISPLQYRQQMNRADSFA